jgi:hypothetical protein
MLDYKEIIGVLANHSVDYIIVGGVSAALNGAPIVTLDLDVVHSCAPRNIAPLLAALSDLDASYRDPAGRMIRPNESHLVSPGHQLLKTRFGPLDLLGTIGINPRRSYDDLLTFSESKRIAGLAVRVLKLATLIQIKEELHHEKDLMTLQTLKRTLEEQSRR